ncbi:MAG: MFS transporter [Oscillatoriaceae bacterium SKW80]|nr:MFS transporter [Oscillatoriaceae bacterium SKYG93]MCX8121769.1 MFS transporter [Oscillatoriaceae bacterium SKW80]MDW8453614.1 MFS transporter [Oscillatoriaceae cyanobacterium SKYGB_i_bin93]HIK28679.1 MFS transporter [Oscillatoriaceae cyanobacterium M7585_C2015_266]
MQPNSKNSALKFVILLGTVSLCADATYEGARSITGAYLSVLGASGTVVGLVAGLGELIGYGLRLLVGYISDKLRKYWGITTLGYFLNTAVVPMLSLAGSWQIAAGLMIAERTGKAIRTPPRDVLLSHAAQRVGRGFAFGLHEALDQIGAVMGPLAVAAVLYFQGEYRSGFAILIVPALLGLTILLIAQRIYPNPRDFEEETADFLKGEGLPPTFWIYLGAVALIAAGYADFPLIAYHFERKAIASGNTIPLFYALAMGIDALAAVIFGRLFDRAGLYILMLAAFISSLFAPLIFLGNSNLSLLGMALWGIGMGAQESILKAAIAGMVPADRRGSAYGIFQAGYGFFWFLGSLVMGILYDLSINSLVVFSLVMQLGSIPLLWLARKALI